MEDIKLKYINNICSFCTHNLEENCKDIHKTIINDIVTYKCFNYKKKEKMPMKTSKIADHIMADYAKQKRYENNKKRSKLEEFRRKNCVFCKNQDSNLCHIVINVNKELQCVYKEI